MTLLGLNPVQSSVLMIGGAAFVIMILFMLLVSWLFRFWVDGIPARKWRLRLFFQVIGVLIGILILWAGLVIGIGWGFDTWQAMPDPPDEAFADGGPLIGSFIFGWVPAGALTIAWWGILTAALFLLSRRNRAEPPPASVTPPIKNS